MLNGKGAKTAYTEQGAMNTKKRQVVTAMQSKQSGLTIRTSKLTVHPIEHKRKRTIRLLTCNQQCDDDGDDGDDGDDNPLVANVPTEGKGNKYPVADESERIINVSLLDFKGQVVRAGSSYENEQQRICILKRPTISR